jgi:hypothetical protein
MIRPCRRCCSLMLANTVAPRGAVGLLVLGNLPDYLRRAGSEGQTVILRRYRCSGRIPSRSTSAPDRPREVARFFRHHLARGGSIDRLLAGTKVVFRSACLSQSRDGPDFIIFAFARGLCVVESVPAGPPFARLLLHQ